MGKDMVESSSEPFLPKIYHDQIDVENEELGRSQRDSPASSLNKIIHIRGEGSKRASYSLGLQMLRLSRKCSLSS